MGRLSTRLPHNFVNKVNMKRLTRLISLLVLLTLLFTSALTLTSCSTNTLFGKAGTEEILPEETLRENMTGEKNKDLEYVWQYLDRWQFPLFDKAKIKKVEKLFRDNYYKELPSAFEIATVVGTDFLDNSYGEIDLTSSVLVSDAILTAFVDSVGDRYAYYRTSIQFEDYKDNMSGTKPSFYGIGIEVPQPLIKDGIPVSLVLENSPAEIAGILPGDLITAVHERSVIGTYFDDAVNEISGKNLKMIKLTVKRGEDFLDLTVSPDYSGSFDSYYKIGVTLARPVIENELVISKVIRNAPAYKAGLLDGDAIIAIDGQSVHGLSLETVTDRIKGESGTDVTVTVRRGEEVLDVTVTRGPVVTPTVDYWIIDGIGYIEINSFKANTDEAFIEAVDYMTENEVKAIIYDVRNNGGGYLDSVVNMLDYIAKDGNTIVSFSNDYGKPEKAKDGHSLSIPSVILCNGASASAAELFTVGMRDIAASDGFAISIVGQTTYGKFIMQNSYSFTDGSAVTFTVAYYYSPVGDEYDGIGITPNLVVLGTAEQEEAAFDEAQKLSNK